MAVAACVAVSGLSGCCAPKGCGCRDSAQADAEPGGMSDGPVPAAPEYPRFHPVPTRPVFLPDGVEPLPAQSRLVPTPAPALSTVPSSGWHATAKVDAPSPALQDPALSPLAEPDKIESADPSGPGTGWHSVGPTIDR